jgi:uncharacterized protein YuzE
MKIRYFQDTDTLYIELRPALVSETRDLDENTVIDLDDRGTICAITIEHASERMLSVKLTTPCATTCLDHQASTRHQASAHGYGRPDRPTAIFDPSSRPSAFVAPARTRIRPRPCGFSGPLSAAFHPWGSTTPVPTSLGARAQAYPGLNAENAKPGSGRGAQYRWTGVK